MSLHWKTHRLGLLALLRSPIVEPGYVCRPQYDRVGLKVHIIHCHLPHSVRRSKHVITWSERKAAVPINRARANASQLWLRSI